jgi:signal peptidase
VSAARTWLRWALLGLALGFVLVLAGPRLIGWRTLTVVSGSMAPAIEAGDVVVTRPVAPASARPGDVVTFVDPQRRSRLVTHRVMRTEVSGGRVEFHTKGDANTAGERWSVATGGRIGVVEYRIPLIGRGMSVAGSAAGRLVLVAVPALLWGLLSLRAIWREPAGEVVGHAAS